MKVVFRKVEENEIKAVHDIIAARTDWLNQQGIHQWPRPLTEDILRERQQAGRLFGYWRNHELVVVVCLLEKAVLDWGDLLQGKFLCMATLAGDLRYQGKGNGQACAIAACDYARERGYEKMYLDCVDYQGILPGFYTRLGFQSLGQKILPDGRTLILMVRPL